MNSEVHQVELVFDDGVVHTIAAETGQSLLDAALAADVPVMYQCRSGSCSSCISTVADGDVAVIPGRSSTLLASEIAQGQRLLCVCQATSNARLTLPYSSSAGAVQAVSAHAFINRITPLASDVVKLTLELAEGDWLSFRPGQYIQIEVPGLGVLRSYSPCNTAADLPVIEFMIRVLPDGAMSAYLRDRAETDQVLTLTGPYGAFFLREEHRRQPHIFIAGGTGLAPVLSMIDAIRQQTGIRPPMLLSFGCNSAATLFGQDDIALRQQWLPTLDARICVSREAVTGCLQCNPVEAIQAGDVHPDSVVYLCGPQGMVDAATERLVAFGADPANIYSEQFVASN